MDVKLPPFTEWFKNKRSKAYIALGFLVATACGCFFLIFAPRVPQWGKLHEAHAEDRFQDLRSGQTISQTFVFEHAAIDAVAIFLDTSSHKVPAAGTLRLSIETESENRESIISMDQILPDGLALFRFDPVMQASGNNRGTFHLRVDEPGKRVYVRFQIDATKYQEGEMTHSHRRVQGDMAFQIHYQRYALGSLLAHIGYAIGLMLASLVVVWAFVSERLNHVPAFSKKNIVIAISIGVCSFLITGALIWRDGVWIGPGDFVKDVSYIASSVESVRAGTWPTISQRICGGMPALGNPESNVLSGGTMLGLFVSPEVSLWMLLALEAGIGAAGVYLLARLCGCSYGGSCVAVGIAIFSGAYAYRIVEGFSMIGGAVAFTPWVFLGFFLSQRHVSFSFAVLSGLALTGMIWRGEVHILTGLLLVLVFMTAALIIQKRSLLPVMIMGIVMSVFFIGASVKILAYLEQPNFFAHAYHPYVAPLIQDHLLDDVFLSVHSRFLPVDVRHGRLPEEWANFGSYVGYVPLVLAAIGLIAQKKYRLLLFIGLFISFAIGEGILFDVWLRHIGPLAGLLRIPTRIFAIVVIFLGIYAGAGVDALTSRLRYRYVQLLISVSVVLFVWLDLLAANSQIYSETLWRRKAASSLPSISSQLAIHQNNSRNDELHAGVLLNQGYMLPALCADVAAPPAFIKGKQGTFSLASVPTQASPNRIDISEVAGMQEVIIEERFLSTWVVSDGWIMPTSDDAMRIIRHDMSQSHLTLTYVHSLTRVEQILFCTTLFLWNLIAYPYCSSLWNQGRLMLRNFNWRWRN